MVRRFRNGGWEMEIMEIYDQFVSVFGMRYLNIQELFYDLTRKNDIKKSGRTYIVPD